MEHGAEGNQHTADDSRGGYTELPGPFFQGITAEKLQRQQDQKAENDKYGLLIQRILVVIRHAGRRADGKKIPGLNGYRTEIQHEIIHQPVKEEK